MGVLSGTDIPVTHGMHLVSALSPIFITTKKYNGIRTSWRSVINGEPVMHTFSPFVFDDTPSKCDVCEEASTPSYGPGEGNPGDEFCPEDQQNGGVYYGLQFYGSSDQWDDITGNIGSGNADGVECMAQSWGNDMTYCHDCSCVCIQDSGQ